MRMGDIPSLLSLCMKAITSVVIYGDYNLENIFELPPDLFDSILLCLPPLALQKLHKELPRDFLLRECSIENDFTIYDTNNARKRARFDTNFTFGSEVLPRSISYHREKHSVLPLCCEESKICRYNYFNKAWKSLFDSRWPVSGNQTQSIDSMITKDGEATSEHNICSRNWQYLYWEAHLQNCLDEAAAKALLPAFQGCIGEITMPDVIMKCIGYRSSKSDTTRVSKLSYHCQQFGCYARCLRLQNVLCVAEICELLRNSKLQGIAFRGIKSKSHVDGTCKLLNQNIKTLLSLEFIHCRLEPTALDSICGSLYGEENPSHGIQYFSIKSSRILISYPASLPMRFLSFLSSGRSLCSLQLSDSGLGPEFLKMVFYALLDSLSVLSCLEVSDDMISSWFSKDNGGLPSSSPSSLGIYKSLKELRVLNLRGSNLSKDNADSLKSAMLLMPHLRSLDISDNPIGDDGIRILVPCFVGASEKGSCLVDVKIENCDLSYLGAAVLLSGLSKSLRSLSIAHNSLGSQVAAALVNFLQTSSIRILNLEAIGLGLSGFVELEEAMLDVVGLISFNMSKNRGGYGAANLIAKLISWAPELLSIDAGYNFIRPESLDVIYTALKLSKGKIKRLDLTGVCSCNSTDASMFDEFQFEGKPIVIFSSFDNLMAPYDDDP